MNVTVEERIRRHYVRVADELVLDELEFADVLERGAVADTTGPASHEPHRLHSAGRWIAAAAVVVLVVGGLTVLTGRNPDERTAPATQPTVSAPASAPVAASCDDPRWSPGGLTEPAAPPPGAPNELLLPADTPAGFCVSSARLDNIAAHWPLHCLRHRQASPRRSSELLTEILHRLDLNLRSSKWT